MRNVAYDHLYASIMDRSNYQENWLPELTCLQPSISLCLKIENTLKPNIKKNPTKLMKQEDIYLYPVLKSEVCSRLVKRKHGQWLFMKCYEKNLLGKAMLGL